MLSTISTLNLCVALAGYGTSRLFSGIRLKIGYKNTKLNLFGLHCVGNLCGVVVLYLAKITRLVYTFASSFWGGTIVSSHIGKACLVLVVALIVFLNACLFTPQVKDGGALAISNLETEYTSVYPRNMSQIKCITSAPEGDTVNFIWSTDGGSIRGEGPLVTWEAPDDYGDYHVMVTAKDNNGGIAEAFVTVSVVPRPYKHCCGR
jgi:hypothetical protein